MFGNYINFDLQQVHTTPAAGSEIGIAMETKTLSGGRTVLDTFCVGQSSVFQDISTVPGAIYDVNFDHVSIDTGQNNDVDVLAATIAPSKFSADDSRFLLVVFGVIQFRLRKSDLYYRRFRRDDLVYDAEKTFKN